MVFISELRFIIKYFNTLSISIFVPFFFNFFIFLFFYLH
jgi:hypothetical protein